jgi:hypothetical protein
MSPSRINQPRRILSVKSPSLITLHASVVLDNSLNIILRVFSGINTLKAGFCYSTTVLLLTLFRFSFFYSLHHCSLLVFLLTVVNFYHGEVLLSSRLSSSKCVERKSSQVQCTSLNRRTIERRGPLESSNASDENDY